MEVEKVNSRIGGKNKRRSWDVGNENKYQG